MSAPTTRATGPDVDQMAADAKKRLAAFIARTAAQHQRRMREAWAIAPQVPVAPQTTNTQATPWLDDITPIEPFADELADDKWLADMALTVIAWSAFIFASGFGLGYLTGGG
jgi:hypothetical protein